jgi:hypothetical protein
MAMAEDDQGQVWLAGRYGLSVGQGASRGGPSILEHLK